MSTLACLLLGAAMAGRYHLLPRTRPGRPFRAPLLALGGFILAQGGLSAAIAGLGLLPKGPFHELLQQLTDYDGERAVGPALVAVAGGQLDARTQVDALVVGVDVRLDGANGAVGAHVLRASVRAR